jgi:serine/threonine protein phosphatase PrpC
MNADEESGTSDFNMPDTIDLGMPDITGVGRLPTSTSAHIRAAVAGQTHQGLVRTNNEDHFLAVRFGRTLEVVSSNLPEEQIRGRTEETGCGMLVADGVGGAASGETASRLAITALVSLVLSTPDWILRVGEREAHHVMERMVQRFRDVDAALEETAYENPSLAGMGTTMTLACTLGTQMVLAHVGDSRAYLHRGNRLVRLTHDHTVAQGLADDGMLDPRDVARHHLRNMLTKTVWSGHLIQPDVQYVAVAGGDQVLLCTDGLTEMVNEAAIEAILCGPGDVAEICQALIDRALHNGGKDNVTVILARFAAATEAS